MVQNLARTYSAELEGINAHIIEVEVDLNVGIHSFNIVGLADKALNESRERINSALKNSGIKPPTRENRKITVNLAPADIRKTGSQYDIAIAIGYLLATHQIAGFDTTKKLFAGELSLDGRMRPISGALNIAEFAATNGFAELYVPQENANEAAAVRGIKVFPVRSLPELITHLENRNRIDAHVYHETDSKSGSFPDFSEIRGQENAKRAMTIAAAGGHNLIMVGPPGVGKSLLSKALAGILPKLNVEEAIELTRIYSAAGLSPEGLISDRPFRSPHHTASLVSVIGGGTNPKPGEISLAHRGVLFMDEVPEFPKNLLESLRQPLEDGSVNVARAKGVAKFPAKFSLIAAMNPCPCGYYGDPEKQCRCSAYEVVKYQKKISGPLLDRIDLQIKVPRVEMSELMSKTDSRAERSEEIRSRVEATRERQAVRFKNESIHTNSEMSSSQTERFVQLTDEAEAFLNSLAKSKLSPRGYFRLLKTGRTIADLEDAPKVKAEHLSEAFGFRLRDEI